MQGINKIKLFGALGAIVAGMMLMTGCGTKTNVGAARPSPPEVGVVVVQPQRVALTTELPGRTSPCQVAEVRPQVNGIIQKRVFTEGE